MGILLDRQHVKMQVPAATWEEALREAGRLLVDAGSITSQYIANMIRAVKELGPYIVLMPKLALGHASPGEAVIHTDLSMITLARPVDFGSASGEVTVVFCLACTDKTSHLEMLKKLADVLMQEGIVRQLEEASDVEEAIQILRR